MKASLLACTAIAALGGFSTAQAASPGQPFTNIQPSLALTELMTTGSGGVFPNFTSGGAVGDTDGFIYNFAGNYAPSGSVYTNGQTLPIAGNSAVFSLVGTNYGGNGTTNFGVPNLVGLATVGANNGPGVASGSPSVALTVPTASASRWKRTAVQQSAAVVDVDAADRDLRTIPQHEHNERPGVRWPDRLLRRLPRPRRRVPAQRLGGGGWQRTYFCEQLRARQRHRRPIRRKWEHHFRPSRFDRAGRRRRERQPSDRHAIRRGVDDAHLI